MGRGDSRSRSSARRCKRRRRRGGGDRNRSGSGSRSPTQPRHARGGGGRRSPSRRSSRGRSPSRRRGGGGRASLAPKNARARSNSNDKRPYIEKAKGGVKLFVGRLPREVSQRQLRECFEEFGPVLEVFVIASQAQSGVGCAFIRMETIKSAEDAIAELHEQRVLVPDQAELGPMQVAFAKGEAVRLGLDESEEILPTFREAKQKVVEHQEKKQFFEGMKKQQEFHQDMMRHHQAVLEQKHTIVQMVSDLPLGDLVNLVKDGQRSGGQGFKQRWWTFCDQGYGGRDYDPSKKDQGMLVQFLRLAAVEYGSEPWFRKYFSDLPELPPMPQAPPGFTPPPGGGLPGMPPMLGMPPMPPGMTMPGMPPAMLGLTNMPPMGMLPPPGMFPPGMMPPPPAGPGGPGGVPSAMGMLPGSGRGGPPSGARSAAATGASAERKETAESEEASDSGSEGDIAEIDADDI